MDSRMSRHWIHSFHRMTLYPHLYQPIRHSGRLSRHYHRTAKARSQSLALESTSVAESTSSYSQRPSVATPTRAATASYNNVKKTGATQGSSLLRSKSTDVLDSPLFSHRRSSRGRRWPFGESVNDPPKYRIKPGNERPPSLNSLDFNPFNKYTPEDKRLGNSLSESVTTSSIWTINALPRTSAAQNRLDILRSGERIDRNAQHSIASEGDWGNREVSSINDTLKWVGSSSHTEKPLQVPPQLFDNYRLDSVQDQLVNELIIKINDSENAVSKQDFMSSLQRLGRATMLRWRLPIAFVDSAANQKDVISTGIHTLLSALTQLTDNHWGGKLIDILEEHAMLKFVDNKGLSILLHHVNNTIPKGQTKEERRCRKQRIEALKAALQLRNARMIDHEEWEIRTRQFRLQLASARETGAAPDENDYLLFMKNCQHAGKFRELELVFYHFLDFHPTARELEQQQQLQLQLQNQREDQLSQMEPEKAQQICERVYRRFIKALVRQDRMEHAQEAFNDMKSKGIVPSAITFGALLDGYGRKGDLKQLRLTLRSLYNAGLKPTIKIYTSLMANFIRAGELARAEEVYRQLQARSDLTMDPQCENVVANLLRLKGENKTDQRVLEGTAIDERREEGEKVDEALGLFNSMISYNHKLKRYADASNIPRFIKLFQRIQDRALTPNTTTYNILLDVFLNAGHLEDGLQVLEHMKTTNQGKPDVVTYSMLIAGAVAQEKVDLGWELYSEMRGRSILPSVYTYVSLIELAGLDPSSKIGRTIIKRYAAPGRPRVMFSVKPSIEEQIGLNFAGSIYSQLCAQGLKPNEYVFSTLLNLAASGGHIDLAPQIYEEMIRQSVEPNTAIMTALIKGFAIRMDFDSGWRVWRHMVQSKIPRNAVTYQHLIRLCKRSLRGPNKATEDSVNGSTLDRPKRQQEEGNCYEEEDVGKNECAEASLESISSEIPPEIMAEILEQMKLDHVDWSRVQQFKHKKVDYRIWDPVVREVGPVTSAAAAKETAAAAASFTSEDESGVPLRERQIRPEVALNGPDLGTSFAMTTNINADGSSSFMIKEIFSGGGDGYVPMRRPHPALIFTWDTTLCAPVLGPDADIKAEKGGLDLNGRCNESNSTKSNVKN